MNRFRPVSTSDGLVATKRSDAAVAHARALLAWLPLLPLLGVSLSNPASGILSDSFASTDGAGWQLAAIWAYSAAALAECLLLEGRSTWLLAIAPCYAAVVLTTFRQDLLTETSACNSSWCVLHQAALLIYCGAELAGLRARGYVWWGLSPYALALLVLAVWYRSLLDASGFDAADPATLQRLRLVGALEIGAFAIARALVAGA